jgi:hypothetical protein
VCCSPGERRVELLPEVGEGPSQTPITIFLQLDEFAAGAAWVLLDDANERIASSAFYPEPFNVTVSMNLEAEGTYTFIIFDEFNRGLVGVNYMVVLGDSLDGEVLVAKEEFISYAETTFTIPPPPNPTKAPTMSTLAPTTPTSGDRVMKRVVVSAAFMLFINIGTAAALLY